MENNKNKASGTLVAVIVVCILLLLLGGMQYSLKHGLPIAKRIGAWLANGNAYAPAAAATEAPASDATATAAPEIDLYAKADSITTYATYLRETLVPAFGQATQAAVAAAQSAGYASAGGADGATGLISAQAIDLDQDRTSELAVLLIRQVGGAYPLELHVYGLADGTVRELTEAGAVITDMALTSAALTESVEILSQGTAYYLLYHQYVEKATAFYDRYIAFDMTAGMVKQVLDGVYASYGGAVLVANVTPPWLDDATLSGAPDLTEPMSGLSGKGLYADAITDASYGEGAASFSAYTEQYENAFTALDAMLGPLSSANRMPLLDPLSRDWTGLAGLLSGEAADTAENAGAYDEAPDGEYEPEFDEALDGYAPPDDYVELETPA